MGLLACQLHLDNFFGLIRMAGRRAFFAVLVAGCALATLGLMAVALSPGGWSFADMLALLTLAVVLPWLSVGLCNALVALALEWFSPSPLRSVNPMCSDVNPDDPVTMPTAILLCIRNESTDRLVRNLQVLGQGLAARHDVNQFHVYVLSDTTDAALAEQEAQAFDALAHQWSGTLALTYRRRVHNTGYKAGNIQDFCAQFGANHELALVLDADSLMSAQAVGRLVLAMQAQPAVGILQGLVVGMPAASLFTRLFQFGMRLGMRSYTLGSAWWQGDCGPFWGHNAIIRIAPFAEHCRLPLIEGRRGQPQHILSHDQIEAALMRRAGFEVRVYPLEDESYEENPPNMLDFVARDLRWCAGNMQYTRLVGLPGLTTTSRVQLVLAVLMFVGAPAWLALLGILGWSVHHASFAEVFYLPALVGVFALVVLMVALPRLVSVLVVMSRRTQRRRFGGGVRFLCSFLLEQLFSMMLAPVMWVSQTLLLAGLPFGKRTTWGTQNRELKQVRWSTAIRVFGLHTFLGALLGWLWLDAQAPATWLVAYFLGGLWLAVPLAVVTAWPWLGRLSERTKLAATPEEFEPSAFLVHAHGFDELNQPVIAGTTPSEAAFEPGR